MGMIINKDGSITVGIILTDTESVDKKVKKGVENPCPIPKTTQKEVRKSAQSKQAVKRKTKE